MANAKSMTRADLEAYRSGWRAVKQMEREELRRAPLALRLKQMNMIFGLARALNLRRAINDRELVAVRERWRRLKANRP